MRVKFEMGKLHKRLRWLYLCFVLVTVLLAVFPMESFADALASVKSMGTTVVTDIAATQDGKLLYVTESSSSPIYMMNADGSNAAALGSQTFMFPKYLFVDHSNNIFVLDFQSTSWNSARITKLNSSGSILWQSNYLDITNYSIVDMAAFDNYVYLVDTSYKVLRIYSYNSSTGNLDYVNGIGGMFAGDEPYYPTGVTAGWNSSTSAYEVYITDVYRDITNGRTHGVFKMNATGGDITEVNKNVGDISPDQITVDSSGNVYFIDGGSGINKIDYSTKARSLLLSPPHSASDITVGPSGQVYITCYDTSVTPTVYDITRLAFTPVVSGLSVSSGPVTGGTSVTINGTGFTGATAVTFGGAAASSFTVNSDTSITATAPTRSGGTLGPVHIIVTAPGGTSTTNSSDQFTYTPGPAASLTISALGTQTAGTSFSVTVTAKDQYGNTATGYTGTVHFTTTNGNSPNGTSPSLPSDYTFTVGDAGTHTFNGVELYNKAVSTITAADTVTGTITVVTGNITVNAGAVNESNSNVMSGKASVLADDADNTSITVTLKDDYNNPVNGKTVSLDKGSGSSTISPTNTTSGADGTASFSIKNTKAETVTYTVMVNSAATSLTKQVTFTPGTAVSLSVSAAGIQTAGTSFSVTVTAKDQYGNIATGYTGTIHFTTTNGNSPNVTAPSLPSDYTFTAGDEGMHTINGVTLYNKAASIITAADTATGTITGVTGNITVNAGAVNESNSSVMSGKSSVLADNADNTSITVTLKDDYSNPVNGKTVSLDNGSGSSTISPASTTSGADGTASFSIKNTKAETVTYTVMVNSAATSLTRQVTFTPGTAVSLLVSAAGIQTAGTSFPVTVTAKDQYGNTATGYTGTVRFNTNNGQSPDGTGPSLPEDYTFTLADGGTHTFSNEVTLYNATASTLTAIDTVNGAINGTTGNMTVNSSLANAENSTMAVNDTEITANDTESSTITVTLKDDYGNIVSGKTVTLLQGSGGSSISPSSATSGVGGTANFTVKSTKAETVIYTAEVNGVTVTQTAQVTFIPGSPEKFGINAAGTQTAGVPFIVTVTVQDHYGNTITDYTGTVRISTNNGNSPNGTAPSLPEDYIFTLADGGTHTFSNGVILYNAALSTLTVTDTGNGTIVGTKGSINVNPGQVDEGKSTVAASDSEITADGTDCSIIEITLRDAYENPISGVTASIDQGDGSSDISSASNDSDVAGTVTFTVTSTTAEEVTYTFEADGVTLNDTAIVTFESGVLDGFIVSTAGTQMAGAPINVTVTARDANGNTITDYTGTVRFSTNNGQSPNGTDPSLPEDYTFTLEDEGTHTFSTGVILYNATLSELTVTGEVNGTNTDTTRNIMVNPGPVDGGNSKVESDFLPLTANDSDSKTITVTLKDHYKNLISNVSVTLDQGDGSSDITPASAITDAAGTVTFTVTSRVAEEVTYTATANGVSVTQTAQVNFIAGNVDANRSGLAAVNPLVAANGANSSTITVTLRDAFNNPVSGKTVTLNQSSGSSIITTVNSTSDANGMATFDVKNATVEVVTYTATANGVTVTQTAAVNFAQPHTIIVSANPTAGGTVSGGGAYAEGASVEVTATANSGFKFVNWTEGTAVISTSSAFSFTVDIADRTLSANFSSTHSSSGNTSTPASDYRAALSGNGVKGTTLLTTVDANAGNAGISLGNLADDVLGGEETAVITVPPISGVNAYTLRIPATSLSGSQREGELTFTTEKGSITISDNMLEGIAGIGGKEAGITIEQGDKANLSDEIKAVLGDRPLIRLTLTLDGKQNEWNNLNAPAVVSIPYTPTVAELADPENIVVWYIDGAGNAVSVPNGHYDPETGSVVFSTTHFSDYAVAYNKIIFGDVAEKEWYSDAVNFIAARGITTGTSNGTYSPKAKLTRGEFLVMMMRSYSIAPDEDQMNNFSDAGNTYYSGYLAAAKNLGISDGVGGNMFAPSKQISRQEMLTLLYNALKVIDQLPEGTEGSSLSSFSDADKIASWAKDAMTMLVETGTISGSGDHLSPTDVTNRAEMAQVLYNLLLK